jgi:hypothetical protein
MQPAPDRSSGLDKGPGGGASLRKLTGGATMRIVYPAALVSTALVLSGFAATFPILAADPPPPGCTGDRWYY